MSIGSKMKIGNRGMFITSVFYAFVGVVFLVLLPMSAFPPHIGILGTLSLVTAYGLFRKRTWSFWFVVVLLFSSTAFALFMIYAVFTSEYLIGLGLLSYLVFSWVFTIYVFAKRRTLEGQSV